ncbi:MAG: glycosyltransferase family 2 protein [Burkholderiaceae bacterium]|nr:glycosyltransferase family 2 protein [Burkholderiaceae bacterium]
MGPVTPSVWIVVLNWNNGRDTVECLQSIQQARDPAVTGVVVCDNGSSDDSCELIRAWARDAHVDLAEHLWHSPAFTPAVPAGAAAGNASVPRFVLVQTGANLGFAGGNNVGLCFVQQLGFDGAVLLLNNDVLVTPGCVSAMAKRLASDPQVGMCGCTVLYHFAPDTVQAWGGARFQPWLARASHLGAHASMNTPRDATAVERQLDYILGASLMISARCLAAIGLMEERYFLYYEEIDWALRARRQGFTLAYVPEAVVFHKEGGTIGSSADKSRRSLLSEHYLVRSCLLFTRKFYPWYLPTVVAYSLLLSLRVLLRGDRRRASTRVRAMLGMSWQR